MINSSEPRQLDRRHGALVERDAIYPRTDILTRFNLKSCNHFNLRHREGRPLLTPAEPEDQGSERKGNSQSQDRLSFAELRHPAAVPCPAAGVTHLAGQGSFSRQHSDERSSDGMSCSPDKLQGSADPRPLA